MRQRYVECPQCRRHTATRAYRPGISWGIHCPECNLSEWSKEYQHPVPHNWIMGGPDLIETPRQVIATDAYLAASDACYHVSRSGEIPTSEQLDRLIDAIGHMLDTSVAAGDTMDDIGCRLRMLADSIDRGAVDATRPEDVMAEYQLAQDDAAEAARRWVD